MPAALAPLTPGRSRRSARNSFSSSSSSSSVGGTSSSLGFGVSSSMGFSCAEVFGGLVMWFSFLVLDETVGLRRSVGEQPIAARDHIGPGDQHARYLVWHRPVARRQHPRRTPAPIEVEMQNVSLVHDVQCNLRARAQVLAAAELAAELLASAADTLGGVYVHDGVPL